MRDRCSYGPGRRKGAPPPLTTVLRRRIHEAPEAAAGGCFVGAGVHGSEGGFDPPRKTHFRVATGLAAAPGRSGPLVFALSDGAHSPIVDGLTAPHRNVTPSRKPMGHASACVPSAAQCVPCD
ncbi:protein of unknown function (plasmid) [Cupriavidus taiwanensis]|uniref:Uncharacterized protein n=1 Tax=Cupriavidus taiwanensis TaxID=164546 RepID=A0A375IRA6_9BURK|nr:protein of unknown function [Cupriavidus taiwanensis]